MGHPDRLRTVQDRQFVGGEDVDAPAAACSTCSTLLTLTIGVSARLPDASHASTTWPGECAHSGDSGQRCPPLVGARVQVFGLKRTVVAVLATLQCGGVHPTVERGVAAGKFSPSGDSVPSGTADPPPPCHRGLEVGVTLLVGSRGCGAVPFRDSADPLEQPGRMVDTLSARSVRPGPDRRTPRPGRHMTSVERTIGRHEGPIATSSVCVSQARPGSILGGGGRHVTHGGTVGSSERTDRTERVAGQLVGRHRVCRGWGGPAPEILG